MANVFIIHGSYGHPQENWFPWLKSELEKLDCKVFAPEFPTPEKQSLKSWLKVFEDYKQYLDENSVVIGHSTGCAFLLNVLEKSKSHIKAAFFISGFLKLKNNLEINKSFTDRVFNWNKIKKSCKHFYVFHSDNDPHIPLHKAQKLAKTIGVNVILVKNAGHFNEKSGYKKFDLLLEKVKEVL